MQNDDGQAIGIAALLDMDAVAIADIDHPLVEGINGRVERAGAGLSKLSVHLLDI